MLRIGSIELENGLILAPMAGISNLAFRRIVKRMGAGLVTTEMISAKGLLLGQRKTLEYLRSDPEEKPLSVQIFGSDPEVMAGAAQLVIDGGADLVDINLGCPVRKVLKTGAGAQLIKDCRKLERLFVAVRKSCSVPLTAKMRAGWDLSRLAYVEVGRILEGCGLDAVTLHARTVVQGYSGEADWKMITELREKLNIPVIGNGDVTRAEQALEMKAQTGCDGVMIGRGAIGNPWIFRQIEDMQNGRRVREPTLRERKALIMAHFQALCEDMGEPRAARVMRGLLMRYTKGLPWSAGFRGAIVQIKSMETLMTTLEGYLMHLEAGRR